MSPRGTTLYDEDILSWCSQWYTCCMLMLRAREIPTWVGMQGSLDLARVQLAAAGRGGRPLFYSSAVLYSCTVYWIQYSCTTAVLQYSCTVQLQYSCTTAVIQLYYSCTTAVAVQYSCSIQLQQYSTAVVSSYSCSSTVQLLYYSCTVLQLYQIQLQLQIQYRTSRYSRSSCSSSTQLGTTMVVVGSQDPTAAAAAGIFLHDGHLTRSTEKFLHFQLHGLRGNSLNIGSLYKLDRNDYSYA